MELFNKPLLADYKLMYRIWGGDNLKGYNKVFSKDEYSIGESWEISDRKEYITTFNNSDFNLNELWKNYSKEVFNKEYNNKEFPLLAKILDANDTLSVQVHPHFHLQEELNGQEKNEMWFIADANKDAFLYIGLKNNITKRDFQKALESGDVENCLHKIKVKAGDYIFIPSGRVHEIGKGCVIVEMQQNSNTTYRVFDYNRLEKNGKPRDLHIKESLMSIDFNDYQPEISSINSDYYQQLVNSDYFDCYYYNLNCYKELNHNIVMVLDGVLKYNNIAYNKGDFIIIPHTLPDKGFMADCKLLVYDLK